MVKKMPAIPPIKLQNLKADKLSHNYKILWAFYHKLVMLRLGHF